MQDWKKLFVAAIAVVGLVGFGGLTVGCEEQGPGEELGEAFDDAGDRMRDASGDAADNVEDAADNAADRIENAAD